MDIRNVNENVSLFVQNMNPLWKVTAFEQHIYIYKYIYIYSSQHKTAQRRTAQRMTARRSVIHPSFYPSSVLVTVRATKIKIAKIISDREIIMVIFPEFGSLLRSPGFCLPEFCVKIKKTVGNHLLPTCYSKTQ